MHLFYHDEVKHNPQQPAYWLGGICAAGTALREIEEAVSDVSEEFFGSRTLAKETEFHGIEICQGKGNLKGKSVDERVEILEKILPIIGRDNVYRVCVRILPENLVATAREPDEIAFMYLVEQAESLFAELNTIGMMFGDYDEPNVGKSVASLAGFRRGGTHWAKAQEIERIVDTVHFARSHHSRMIQLADVFLYCMQFSRQKNESPWRRRIADVIRASGIEKCHRSKAWPLERYWWR